MKIGYLGPPGSFTHAAAQRVFPEGKLIPFLTIAECIAASLKNEVKTAVVPIENTTEGTVNQTTDHLFFQKSAQVVGEVTFSIQQQLLVHEKHRDDWQNVKKVYSHPQAIAQCQNYLLSHLPEAVIELTASTSAAAQYLSENPEELAASIGPDSAREVYDLIVVQENIQDLMQNQTSFWLIQDQKQSRPVVPLTRISKKMTLILTLPNNLPGALYKALGVFNWRSINLSRIESRPMKTTLGEYFFLLDLEVPEDEMMIQFALEELRLFGIQATNLGSYWTYLA